MQPDKQADVHYRNACVEDALCISVLGTQVFLDTYATVDIRASLAREVLEHFSTNAIAALLGNSSITFIVAELSEHMIGFAQLHNASIPPLSIAAKKVELHRLYVQKQFSGTGIGKSLLHHSENWARSQGAASLWLTAWSGNTHALEFYSKQRFNDVGATSYTFQNETFENRVLIRQIEL